MQAQNVAQLQRQSGWDDVALPQTKALGKISFYSRYLWAIVHVDPTLLVYPSERGSAQCTALEKNRSRGCRALRSPFLRCVWLRLLQLAQSPLKKLFTWMNQPSPPNQLSPANTNNQHGRAFWAYARPALILSATPLSAVNYRQRTPGFATARGAIYDGHLCNDTDRSLSCGQPLFLPSFLSPWSRPAQNLRLNRCLLKSRLQLNLHRPVNTNDLTGRAGSYRPALFARPCHTKVRIC